MRRYYENYYEVLHAQETLVSYKNRGGKNILYHSFKSKLTYQLTFPNINTIRHPVFN